MRPSPPPRSICTRSQMPTIPRWMLSPGSAIVPRRHEHDLADGSVGDGWTASIRMIQSSAHSRIERVAEVHIYALASMSGLTSHSHSRPPGVGLPFRNQDR